MRPVEITVEGFACYRQSQTVSFRELELFAITGPTGSGKSSLIDAMVFALYGRIPRLAGSGPGNPIKEVIAQGKDRASVQFTFAIRGVEYRVLRQVRVVGATVAHLERWDTESDGWVDEAEGVAQVNALVEKLLGLDFDSFVRTVLLPQGQFQRFLAGDPKERHAILSDLLQLGVYGQVMQLARSRANQATGRASDLQRLLDTTYADATPERKKELEAELVRLQARRDELSRARTDVDEAIQKARQLDGHQQHLGHLEQAIGEAERKLAELAARVQGAEDRLRQGEAAFQALQEEKAALCFDPVRFNQWSTALGYLAQMEQVTASLADDVAALADLEEKLDRGEQALARRQKEMEQAEAEQRAAEERHHLAQTADMARALRQEVAVGDPCPVCGQVIEQLPGEDGADLAAAAEALEAAREACRKARAELTRVQVALSGLQATHASVLERRARNQETRGSAERSASEAIDERPLPSVSTAKAYLAEQQEAHKRLQQIEERENGLRSQLERDRELRVRAEAQEGHLRAELMTLGAQRETADQEVRRAWTELIELARRQGWASDRMSADEVGDAATLMSRCQEVHQRLQEEGADVLRAIGENEGLVRRLESAILEAEAYRRELDEQRASAEVAATLAQLLQANQLLAFIERRALLVLAEDGSVHLDTLSQGRYALQVNERGFQVVDRWNADEPRSVHTLSGGETFLASLALALGLAQRLPSLSASTDTSTVLESLFVDEGFGSLDDETLDVAASGLEELFAGRSMVGVITHVEALAERLPVQLEVIKSQTGSTVRVKGGDSGDVGQAEQAGVTAGV